MHKRNPFYVTERHDITALFCLMSKCMSIIKKMTNEKLLKLNFLLHLSREKCVNVAQAFSILGLGSAGTLFSRIQSSEPLTSEKSSNNWTEKEDSALFWAFFHNENRYINFVQGRTLNACLVRMNRWINKIKESQLYEIIVKRRFIVEKWEEENTNTCSDSDTMDSNLPQNIISCSHITLNYKDDHTSPDLGSTNSDLTQNIVPEYNTQNFNEYLISSTQCTVNKLTSQSGNGVYFMSERLLKQKKSNQLAEARKIKAEKNISRVEFSQKEFNDSSKQKIQEEKNGNEKRKFHPLLISVLKKSQDNLMREKPVYDSELKSFWIRVHIFGRKCFNFFSKIFHGPSHSTVISWMKNSKYLKWNDFLSLNNIPKILECFQKKSVLSNSPILLSIDAMKIDEDICIDHTGQIDGLVHEIRISNPEDYRKNHALYLEFWEQMKKSNEIARELYIISACPINQSCTFPIHIFLAHKKNNNDPVIIIKESIKKLTNNKIDVKFIGSDSDTKYRNEFNKQFAEWSKYISVVNGDVMKITKPDITWTNDAAHLLKRGRSRLVTHGRLFSSRAEELSFENDPSPSSNFRHMVDIETLMCVNPHLSETWFRNNGRDSMDDFYPHFIFSGRTLLGILNTMQSSRNFKFLLSYVVPMLCIVRILRDKNANRNIRLKWAYLALFIMLFNYSWMKLQCVDVAIKKENYHSYFTIHMCIDCANWLFSVIHILGEVEESFSMSRIGSITSEHQFSQIRYFAGKEQTSRSIRFAFDRIMAMHELGNMFKEKFEKRMFRCAKIENGIVLLTQPEINLCKKIAYKISLMSGIVFPRECEFYDLVKDFDLKKPNDFNNKELSFLQTLLEDDFDTKNIPRSWRLQSSRFRIGPPKVGRNISIRYATALNENSQKNQTYKHGQTKKNESLK